MSYVTANSTDPPKDIWASASWEKFQKNATTKREMVPLESDAGKKKKDYRSGVDKLQPTGQIQPVGLAYFLYSLWNQNGFSF